MVYKVDTGKWQIRKMRIPHIGGQGSLKSAESVEEASFQWITVRDD
jgi:hypothetical protein